MLPKLNIKEKIEEHKQQLIIEIEQNIKLPVTDIQELSFNPKSYEGSLSIKIGKSGAALLYKYENNKFYIDFDSISGSLTKNWSKIFKGYKSEIEEKICSEFKTSLDKINITTGMKCEIYIEGIEEEKIRLLCEYKNGEWGIRKL